MNFDYNYLKEYNNQNKSNKKIGLLSNISTDFGKTIKLTNNNYFHQINSHTNANIILIIIIIFMIKKYSKILNYII